MSQEQKETFELPEACMNHVQDIMELKMKVKTLEEAFPDGTANHRRAHEEMIAAALADKQFMRELKTDAAKKGLWLLLLVIAGTFVMGLQIKFKQWLGIM